MVNIIIVHRGGQTYLDNTIWIIKHYNPDAKIIILGDLDSRSIALKNNVLFYNLDEYNEPIPYHHYSTNSEPYEKFCFERWFIIKNFCIQQGIDSFIHSDSDNAILHNISRYTYSNASLRSGHVVIPNILWMTTDNLKKICQFYMTLFSHSREDILPLLMPYADRHPTNIIHYSDMYFLGQALAELKIPFESLKENEGSEIFNGNIRCVEIEYRDGKFFKKDSNVQLLNAHFQGDRKWQAEKFREEITGKKTYFQCVEKIVLIQKNVTSAIQLNSALSPGKLITVVADPHRSILHEHIKILQMAESNNWRNVLIIEDDSDLNYSNIANISNDLENTMNKHWDAVYLGKTVYMVNLHYHNVLKRQLMKNSNKSVYDAYSLIMKRDNWFHFIL